MSGDGAVVNEKEICDGLEFFEGFVLVGADGLVGEIPAGGNDGKAQLSHQQVMERGIGEHDAQIGVAGGDGRGDGARSI